MTEEKLQSNIVISHNNNYPQQWGQLFHVANERAHKLQAYKAKSIGIVSGVADLIYISKKRKVATELKIDGSRHDLAKIKKQIKWGEIWESVSKKHHWRMCFTEEQALNCYRGNLEGYTIEQAKKLISKVKTKTLKIQWQENF